MPFRDMLHRSRGEVTHDRQRRRSHERLPDQVWKATMSRVKGEFDEMPCLRLTRTQACALFGLRSRVCGWVLDRLEADGFLMRTRRGEYVRQTLSR